MTDDTRDPAIPDTPQPGARVLTVLGAIGAVLAIVGWVFGLLGMVLGALAHARGDRWGLKVAVVSGITMIVGMVLLQLAVT